MTEQNPVAYPVELVAPDIEPYREGNTGIDYLTTFDSGDAGPHVIINAVTHGNEICGAIAVDTLMKAGIRPHTGKLSFVFNNFGAFNRFDPASPDDSRFVDEDFKPARRHFIADRQESEVLTASVLKNPSSKVSNRLPVLDRKHRRVRNIARRLLTGVRQRDHFDRGAGPTSYVAQP